MARLIEVGDIRFAPARTELHRKGLMGWACCAYGDLQLDGLAVRRLAQGGYALSFPSRVDANGVVHPYYRPLGDDARRAIEYEVIGELRRRGYVS